MLPPTQTPLNPAGGNTNGLAVEDPEMLHRPWDVASAYFSVEKRMQGRDDAPWRSKCRLEELATVTGHTFQGCSV